MVISSSSDDDHEMYEEPDNCEVESDDDGENEKDLNLSLITTEDEDTSTSDSSWYGFKFIGDNWDLNVHASFQRSDAGTRSLHHFHSFALRDRIDFSHLSDKDPDFAVVINEINTKEFIPNTDDIKAVTEEFKIFISRYNPCVSQVVDPYTCTHTHKLEFLFNMMTMRTKVKLCGTFPLISRKKCHLNLKQ